jgi:hypothetical protein
MTGVVQLDEKLPHDDSLIAAVYDERRVAARRVPTASMKTVVENGFLSV